ncbi:hypothetical protein AMECASPLE_037399 [Ameca splendens]|uniref:Uncharacterized protein n=1 Tax=Ameca splendens TaxID=208324 RepID=A0ABV1AGX9_9TELE
MQMFQQLLSFYLLLQTSQRMKLFLIILNKILFISFFLMVKYKLGKDKVSSAPASPLIALETLSVAAQKLSDLLWRIFSVLPAERFWFCWICGSLCSSALLKFRTSAGGLWWKRQQTSLLPLKDIYRSSCYRRTYRIMRQYSPSTSCVSIAALWEALQGPEVEHQETEEQLLSLSCPRTSFWTSCSNSSIPSIFKAFGPADVNN